MTTTKGRRWNTSPMTICLIGIMCAKSQGQLQTTVLPESKPAAIDSHAAPTPLKGDLHLQYFFEAAGETMPYRLYVPTRWDGKSSLPMVVLLHGGGQDENAPFDLAKGELQRQAEQRGYVILCPFGYRRTGLFGSEFPIPAKWPDVPQDIRNLSEQDLTNTIALTEKQYPIDLKRVFLMGNSMGSIGIFHLVMKYPTRWHAVAPSDGEPEPSFLDYDKFKQTPVLQIYGDHDGIESLESATQIVNRLNAHGGRAELLIVKDGTHGSSWISSLNATFSFFDKETKK